MASKPAIIAVLNQKGGVGKTSTCFHASGALSEAGYRVLLVDGDPQGSLTQGFLSKGEWRTLALERTTGALYDDQVAPPSPEALIRPTGHPRIDLIPCNLATRRLDLPDPEARGRIQFALREFLGEVRDRYDYVFVDCPPVLNVSSWNALLAADYVIIPLEAADFGAQGIAEVQEKVDQARARSNPELKLLGYLIQRYKAERRDQRSYADLLRELYGDHVFATAIKDLAPYQSAVTRQTPVSLFDPSSNASKNIRGFVAEALERIGRLTGQQAAPLALDNRVRARRGGPKDKDAA